MSALVLCGNPLLRWTAFSKASTVVVQNNSLYQQGVIQAQGHCLQTLTLLTLLVNSIYKSKDDIIKNSETELKSLRISNSETSQKIETSNTSSNDSANVKRGLEKTCDSYTSPKYAAEDTNS